ncbi:hypothetical protein U1Q18_035028, partial [Sarracenia purpurea var. burkii]
VFFSPHFALNTRGRRRTIPTLSTGISPLRRYNSPPPLKPSLTTAISRITTSPPSSKAPTQTFTPFAPPSDD